MTRAQHFRPVLVANFYAEKKKLVVGSTALFPRFAVVYVEFDLSYPRLHVIGRQVMSEVAYELKCKAVQT